MLVPPSECSTAPIEQAMLCCLAARNYFAHHDYQDEKLLKGESSQFLLGGILLAVLTLLSDQQSPAGCELESQSDGRAG